MRRQRCAFGPVSCTFHTSSQIYQRHGKHPSDVLLQLAVSCAKILYLFVYVCIYIMHVLFLFKFGWVGWGDGERRCILDLDDNFCDFLANCIGFFQVG